MLSGAVSSVCMAACVLSHAALDARMTVLCTAARVVCTAGAARAVRIVTAAAPSLSRGDAGGAAAGGGSGKMYLAGHFYLPTLACDARQTNAKLYRVAK